MAAIVIPFPVLPRARPLPAARKPTLVARLRTLWPRRKAPPKVSLRRRHGPILFSEYGLGPRG